jgi:hypothetical protein
MEVRGQLYVPSALTQGKESDTQWKGGWVGPKTGLDAVEKTKYLFPAPARNRTSVLKPVT